MTRGLELFKPGDAYETSRVVSLDMVRQFRDLSGDLNAIHLDHEYALLHGFREPIVYGNFLGILISYLIGMCLPSREVIILKETIEFRAPVYAGDHVRLRCIVASIHEAVSSVQLKLEFTTETGQIATGSCAIKCL